MTKNQLIAFLSFLTLQATAQEVFDKVPIQLVENYIFIQLSINDQERPLNFLFDTGAGITVVDNQVAEELSLDINAESRISTSGKSLLSKESTSNSLKINKRIDLDSINLSLLDLTHLSKYLKTNVDGVIGYDLLNSFVTETNMDRKEIIFYEPKTFNYKGTVEPIELTRLESNLFGIMINVIPGSGPEQIPLNFEIDTGSDNYLSFHNKTVNEHELLKYTKKQTFKKGFGADPTITTNIRSKVKSVTFGGKTWKNIPVMFEVDPINKRDNSLADGLIGQRLLLDFNIIYNLDKRVVYLEKRK